MESNENFPNFYSFFERNSSLIVLFFGTIVWGLSGLFKNVILLGLAGLLFFFAIFLDYRKNQVRTIFLLCFSVLLIFISFWYVEKQPIYLSVGITAVMAITTAWYSSNNLNQQIKISENLSRRQYIAEIARSIFSAMQLDLLNARRDITNGPFFIALSPLKTTIDNISPLSYLERNVEIRGVPSVYPMSNNRSVIENRKGPHRPARVLLSVPDANLQNTYLPVISELCKNFDDEHNQLNDTLKKLIDKSSLFFEDFKKYCDSLDKYELKDVFRSFNGESPRETFYHYLLRYALIQGIPDAELHQVIDGGGIRTIGKQKEFSAYLQENRGLLLQWLLMSDVSDEVKTIRKTLENLVNLIDRINDQINELFLAWKIQYGLTEDEMNLKEMYLMGW